MKHTAMTPTVARACVIAMMALLGATGCASSRVAPRMPPSLGGEQTGQASWYGRPHHGRKTSSGEVYDMHQLTAAHPTLPFGTLVRVTNLRNGRSVDVRVNDRGPTVGGRVIDLSYAAAERLNAVGAGVFPVRLRVIALPDDGR